MLLMGNTHHNFNKRMDNQSSNVQHILNKRQKSDSFDAHFKQHYKFTTSRMELSKCMMLKIVKHINPIVSMKPFTKPNCNIYIEEN